MSFKCPNCESEDMIELDETYNGIQVRRCLGCRMLWTESFLSKESLRTIAEQTHTKCASNKKAGENMPIVGKEEEWLERTGGAFWKPEAEGESVEGTLLKVREGQYGPLYDVETADGTVVTIPTSAVLQNRISQGDESKEVKIVFDGMQQSKIKGRNPTKLFRVFFKK